ncbi:LOW QUALITY PROTEIN: uncharacterized protein LOC112085271 [Eutrema salsugineum]|uniref:LOW QUALITY PROTEIN: uncharacterized protein LOC112085271 n=1 Tax=Eutrema salsugineum TaxID=72664 RepID=UPI000CED1406|nr:LOW QUALITY PROTEIN: uncharacterized protein LOC112085271 [Eutrema salsugineum]
MRILAWNCQGAGAELTTRRLEELCNRYSPGFMFLSETKNNHFFLQNMQVNLGFDSLLTVDPLGNSGGLALFYSKDFPVKILHQDDRLFDVETIIDGNRVCMSFVYGDPVVKNREYVWERLSRIGISRNEPWFIIGDFNEITGNHEKSGGKKRSEATFLPFRAMIQNCGMIEFPFQGNPLSWVGRRRNGVIRCRLDRALGNEDWHNIFSHTNVEYLKMWGSDHRPMIAYIGNSPPIHYKRFMFDKRWIGKPGLEDSVKQVWGEPLARVHGSFVCRIRKCRQAISVWKKGLITNSQKLIEHLQNELDNAAEDDNVSLEDLLAIKKRLCEAYREEELYWQQKNPAAVLKDIPVKIDAAMNERLTREVSEEEVKRALFSLNPGKAPGPDGFTALFFQKLWEMIKADLVQLIKDFQDSGSFAEHLNETNICLIPKGDRPREISGFRPISLCNVGYKIISKVLSLRLKKLLPELISETQSAFVAGRLITGNILIAQENFHALRSNPACRKRFMAIKTDMSKAYDRVEWSFLKSLMEKMGFDDRWIGWIMYCITSVKYRVLINGRPRGSITPSRGIRQGDPISPYLFILCTEALISQLRAAEAEEKIHGIRIAHASPPTSHLLFADDSLFFCKADIAQSREIIEIIRLYGEASGQQINLAKSSIMFGHDVPTLMRQAIKETLGISQEGALCSKLKSAIANFWWSSKSESRGVHWTAWDSLCNQMKDGGLGFRTIEDFNITLLAKQLWRLLRFPDSLLCRVLKGRYFRYCNPLEVSASNRPSYGWRSIMAAKPLLTSGIRKIIGSGFDTCVWSEPWIRDIPARPSKGLHEDRDPLLYVNTLIDFETKRWKLDRLQELFPPEEITLILGLRPSQVFSRDGYSWIFTKSGNYTVKSGYWNARALSRLSCDLPVQGPNTLVLKAQAWKLKTTRKIKHFVWQCVNGSVPTCQRLFSRHIGSDKGCPRCGAEEETINHVLFECSPAKQVWALSVIPSAPNHFPTSSIFGNLDYLFWRALASGLDEVHLRIFPWILWFLWKARNKKVFENVDEQPPDILDHAKAEEEAWRLANEEESGTSSPGPTPTPTNTSTSEMSGCFIDGSWLDSAGISGLGWIVAANRNISLVGLRGIDRSLSPLHAELDSLLWAMKCVLSSHVTSEVFYTDCLDLISMTANPSDWPTFAAELEDFRSLSSCFSSFRLAHIPRSCNVRADLLAKAARARGVRFSHVSVAAPAWLSLEECRLPQT